MKKTPTASRLLVMLLCAALLVSSLGFGRSTPANKYEDAIELLQAGKYSEAAPAFKALGHYQDAGEYAMYASALAEAEKENYTLAATTMAALGDFMDSSLMAIYFTGRSYESRQRYEDAEEIYASILLFKDVQERVAALPGLILQRDYAEADSCEKRGDQTSDPDSKRSLYVRARSAFTELGSYSDCTARISKLQEKISAVDYAEADALEQQGQLKAAYDAFTGLGGYADSAARAAAVQEKISAEAYNAARAREDAGDLQGAYNAYVALGHYLDARERAAALKDEAAYRQAYTMAENGQYSGARNAYLALENYKDSAEKARLMSIPALAEKTKRVAPGVYAFRMNEQWGLISLHDNLDIKPAWSSIDIFNQNGLAIAGMGSKYGLINLKGETVLPMNYSTIMAGSNGCYTAAIRDGSNWWASYIFSLVGPDGQIITSGWEQLGRSSGGNAYAPEFRDDTIIGKNNKGYALLRKDGVILLDKQNNLSYFQLSSGKYALEAQGSDKLWRFWNLDGTALTDDAWKEVGSFSGGYAPVKNQDGLWGFIRQSDCQVAVAPAYKEVRAFRESYAAVKVGKLWGFIDQKGEMVIEAKYASVSDFSGGMSTVTSNLLGEHIIGTDGELIFFKETVYDLAAGYDADAQYEDAIAAFEALNGYADSDARALQARDKINVMVYARADELEKQGKLLEAAETFDWLGNYADAPQRAAAARETLSANTWTSAEKLESEGKLEEAIAIYLTLGEYRGAAQHAAALREGINQGILAAAEAKAAAQDYEAAIKILSAIPDYKDVGERIAAYEAAIPVRDYNAAAALENEGRFEEAIAAFAAMNGYSDSANRIDALHEKINQRDYNAAAALENEGLFEEAIAAFTAMNGYSDSAARIDALHEKINQREYNAAATLENEGRFEEAIAAFAAMNGYSDAAARIDALHEKINQREYNAAAALENEGLFEEAIAAFAAMNGYSDSAARILHLRELIKERDYKLACEQEAMGDFTRAFEMFTALGDFSDSQARAKAVTEKAEEQKRQEAYNKAMLIMNAGELEEALASFKALGNYRNCPELVAQLEESIRANSYNEAVQLLAGGKYFDALKTFQALGSYSDSAAKAKEAQQGVDYVTALNQALSGKFKDAYNAFTRLGDYKDSKQKAEITGNLSRAGKSQQITEGVLIYEFHGLWGIANLNTNVIVPVKYTSITHDAKAQYGKLGLLKVYIKGGEPYSRSFFHAQDTYGYIDQNGKEIIPCKYLAVSDFNASGNCTIVLFTNQRTSSYSSRMYYEKHLFGIMNKDGQTITPAKWRTLGESCTRNWGDDGLIDMWSNSTFDLALPTFTGGRMKVQTESGTWGFIDRSGKVLGYTNWKAVSDFSDGMAVVRDSNNKATFINEWGQVIGTNTWDVINDFSNGLAAVQKDGKWGFINKRNELVIPCKYKQVKSFQSDGTCDVMTASGTWIVIDKQGNTAFFGN